MKKLSLGESLQLLGNVGVIVGILLLAYELNQNREFARIQFSTSNNAAFQEFERAMLNPELASVWAIAATDSASLTASEIRMLDAFLIGVLNYWRDVWQLEQAGLIEPGNTMERLQNEVPFYLGNAFGLVWWSDLKSSHTGADEIEFDTMVDEVIVGVDPFTNEKWILRLQKQLTESVSAN